MKRVIRYEVYEARGTITLTDEDYEKYGRNAEEILIMQDVDDRGGLHWSLLEETED